MILCKDVHALLHVISLVDWPKHVKFFFFFMMLVSIWLWPGKAVLALLQCLLGQKFWQLKLACILAQLQQF